MKKFFLGASAALALISGKVGAQSLPSQPPAPVVSASAEAYPSAMSGGAPVMSYDGGSSGSTDVLAGSGTLVGSGAVSSPGARIYTEASFLLMWTNNGQHNFPIATGGPSLGIVGRPGTTLFAGNDSVDYGSMPGFKVGVGGLVGATSVGFEANLFVLGRVSENMDVGPTATTVLARPFFDVSSRRESSKLLAAAGAFTGGLSVNNTNQIWGFETNPFFRIVQGNSVSLDVVTGFRYLSVNERLDIYDSTRLQGGGVSAFDGIGLAAPSILATHDKYGVRNQFYGANIGGRLSFTRGALFLDAIGKIAIGGVRQVVNVDGTTSLLSGGGLVSTATTPGGFYANLAATGERSENRFAVLPEGSLQLGYQMTSWLNVFGGYQVMYLSSVARPGDQVDRNINVNNLPTVPTYTSRGLTKTVAGVNESDLFIHGFTFGLTLTY